MPPHIRPIGKLTPEPLLLAQILDARFAMNAFTNSARAPDSLKALLAREGYELDDEDETHGGILFASTVGVPMHTDEKLSALWVLAASDIADFPSQFVVGGEYVDLQRNDVLIFDATVPHGLIASSAGLWAVFSIYVREATAS
jgi:hypothetical protein